MNWSSATSLLADMVDRPVVLLDDQGAILLANQAFETLTARSREQLVGRRFLELVAPEWRERSDALLASALVGARRRGDVAIVTESSERIAITFELLLMPAAEGNGLLCLAVATRVDAPPRSWPSTWLEIRTDDRFGEVVAAQDPLQQSTVGHPCHRVVFEQDGPCADCPVPTLGTGESCTEVRVLPGGLVMLQRVHRTSIATAQVSYTPLRGEVVARIIEWRLSAIAERCALSEREREVLDELVSGRTLDDIAEVLKISTRTVRFHQTNVLAKLGVESRLDLIRLLLK